MIELNKIGKVYNRGKENEVAALTDLTLSIEEGEMLALMGPSGSGKSTLLYILAFLESPDSGKYILFGEDTASMTEKKKAALRNRLIGFVMQDYGLIPSLSAIKNVELPLLIAGSGAKEAREKALQALRMVSLEDKCKEKAGKLSGGQQQRVAIARSLVSHAKLILADEPTGALDSENSQIIMDILGELNKKGTTVIVATHDPIVAARCRRIVRLLDGSVKDEIRQTE